MTGTSLNLAIGAWRLAEPWGLFALALCPLPWIAARRRTRLAWPTLEGFRRSSTVRSAVFRHVPSAMKSAAIACLAVALARPQTIGGQVRVAGKGVAIEVAIDRSSSMTTEDFPTPTGQLSRLKAAKNTLERFIAARTDDLIGIVAFANIPDRIVPPTLDHAFALDAVRSIGPARAGEGGTSLGLAIAMSLGELRTVKTPRKVVILMTDGRDSPSASESFKPVAPEAAARLAKRLGITLHTIAIGAPHGTPRNADPEKPGIDVMADSGPDLERLASLAALGGGRSFTATDAGELEAVFAALDSLEKSNVVGTIHTQYREGYPWWVAAAVLLLLLDRLLEAGPLRRLP